MVEHTLDPARRNANLHRTRATVSFPIDNDRKMKMVVSPRDPRAYPFWIRIMLWFQRRRFGAVLHSSLIWSRVPLLFAAGSLLYRVLDRKGSPLDPRLRSLLTVRVSQINDCAFCVDLNADLLARRGVTEDKIDALARWRDSDAFESAERAALAYAEAMTRTDANVTRAKIGDLRQHFSDDEIVELTALIAFQNMSSKFNNALGIPPQGFCVRTELEGSKSCPDFGRSEVAIG